MNKWLDIDELAKYLTISKSTIYKMLSSSQIPGHKVGRHWRFDQNEIDNWVRNKNASIPKKEGRLNKSQLLLSLLYAPDALGREGAPINGITRLEKLVFLIKQEAKILSSNAGTETFSFIPYKMGPWTPEIYDEVDFLESLGLITTRSSPATESAGEVEEEHLFDELIVAKYQKNEQPSTEGNKEYKLTEKGKAKAEKAWTQLSKEERDFLINLKRKFNHMNLKQFLRYIYKKYPEFATESEIKDSLGS